MKDSSRASFTTSRVDMQTHSIHPSGFEVSTSSLLSLSNPRVLVAAHRGAWQAAPENSITSLADAVTLGADIVELDVRSTSDEVLVLLHDATLDRTTDGKGTLSQLRYSDVKGFKLRSRDGGDGKMSTFLKLPTLAGALEVARDQVILNIDVKDTSLMNTVAQIVIAAGMADQVFIKAKIQSQSDISIIRSSPFFGRVAFVPIIKARSGFFEKDLRTLEPLRSLMYEVEFTEIETLEEGCEELSRQHARLWVNTIDCSHSLDFNDSRALVDPDAVWGRLLQAGVGAIQTDHTSKLVEYLKFTGRRS